LRDLISSRTRQKHLRTAQSERVFGAQPGFKPLALLFRKLAYKDWSFHGYYCNSQPETYPEDALGNDGVTDNDPKDPDTGANNLQNFPVLSSATRSSDGTTTILGKLNSTPRKVFTIQFFSNPSAAGAEGEKFLGELNVKTGRKGTVSFKFITTKEVAVGEVVTATATAFSTNDTSEFSAAETVAQGS